MAIYKLNPDSFFPLEETTFESLQVHERRDLQRLLRQQPEIVSPETLIIAEEFGEWEDSRKRIDLLGIDKQARLVVIELKRDETGSHMELQAIRYSSMVSTVTFERAVEIYAQFLKKTGQQKDAQEALLEFLDWDEPNESEFASDVRIVLAAAEFSKELTTAVLWLNERELDICCVRLKPYKIDGQIFVDVQQIIPLPEAEEYQIRVREQTEQRREARRGSRDYSKYKFDGETEPLGKGRLVLAVVKASVLKAPPTDYKELKLRFPGKLGSGWEAVLSIEEIENHNAKKARDRYFMGEDEIIKLASNESVAVSTQWGNNFEVFLNHAKNLGFQIEKVI